MKVRISLVSTLVVSMEMDNGTWTKLDWRDSRTLKIIENS